VSSESPATGRLAHLHGIKTPRYLDHGGRYQNAWRNVPHRCGRSNDDLEIAADFDELFQIADQEIDIQAALVRLVENDRAVLPQLGSPCVSARRSRRSSALSLYRPNAFVEPHFVAHQRADFGPELVGERAPPRKRAAMRRGCVWRCGRRRPRPISRRICGNWVVLPEPVSPHTMTTGVLLHGGADRVALGVDGQRGSMRSNMEAV